MTNRSNEKILLELERLYWKAVQDKDADAVMQLVRVIGSACARIADKCIHRVKPQIDSFPIDNINSFPLRLIRWGQNGLAFNTEGDQVFVIAGNFVH
jgi:hypothetical protein